MSRQDIILNAWVCAKLHSSLNHRPLGTSCPLELAWFPWITTFCTHCIRSKFWGSPEFISYPHSSLKTRECHGDGQTADLPPHRCHLSRILPRSLLTRQLWALEKSEHRGRDYNTKGMEPAIILSMAPCLFLCPFCPPSSCSNDFTLSLSKWSLSLWNLGTSPECFISTQGV